MGALPFLDQRVKLNFEQEMLRLVHTKITEHKKKRHNNTQYSLKIIH
jgi:hypothetical protein